MLLDLTLVGKDLEFINPRSPSAVYALSYILLYQK